MVNMNKHIGKNSQRTNNNFADHQKEQLHRDRGGKLIRKETVLKTCRFIRNTLDKNKNDFAVSVRNIV